MNEYSNVRAAGLMILDCLKLNEISKDLEGASQSFVGYNESIYAKIGELASYWQGPDYDAFVSDANTFKPSLEEIVKLFNDYASIVSLFGSDGESLISVIKQNLDCSDISVTLGDGVYAKEDIGAVVGSALGYGTNIGNVSTAKDALKHAQDVQNKLYYDLEVIAVEILNEQNNLAALEANRGKYDPDVYVTLRQSINDRISVLEGNRAQYEEVYNLVCSMTANSSADIVDLITGKENDGKIRGAADGWFGFHDDKVAAMEGLKEIDTALAELPPITTFVESSNVNGLLAYEGEGYHYDSFRNGVNVSTNAMKAAFALAEGEEGGTSEVSPGVVLFNSKQFVLDGQENNYNMGSTTHVFSQADAYSEYKGSETFDGGYDSVRISNDDGSYTYLTYAQYQKLNSTTANALDSDVVAAENLE